MSCSADWTVSSNGQLHCVELIDHIPVSRSNLQSELVLATRCSYIVSKCAMRKANRTVPMMALSA
jgi:hypothetical protein